MDRDCQAGMKCMSADDQDDEEDRLVARWCTGVPKFKYCFPTELEDADDGCLTQTNEYTCGMTMFGFPPQCTWNGQLAIDGECENHGDKLADPEDPTGGSCGGCIGGSTGAGTPKLLACAALSNECALVLDTAQREKYRKLFGDSFEFDRNEGRGRGRDGDRRDRNRGSEREKEEDKKSDF